MNIIDTIQADQIEVGDQILVDGDPIEVRSLPDTYDLDEVVVVGYSHETGGIETYSLPFDYDVEIWAV
jgi:hypothetical protein